MMKKGVFALAVFFVFLGISSKAQAKQTDFCVVPKYSDITIPQYVIDKAYSKVHKTHLPEERAYIVTKDNRRIDLPQGMKIDDMNSIRLMTSIPYGNSFTHTFNRYDPNYVKRDWHYGVVSILRCENRLKRKINAHYELLSNVTKKASVSTSITAKAEIKAAFLAKLEAEAGVTAAYEKTWHRGWRASVSATVEPKTTAYITNYQVGIEANGAIVYDVRTPHGGVCGVYREPAGGTVLSESDMNLELTATEPNR